MRLHPLAGALALAFAFAAPAAQASASGVVISQVYGGNGNTWTNDFVELTNAGGAPVSVAGWSVQYASSTGTGTFAGNGVVALPALLLQPGQRLLVALAGSTTGAALPTPDATGSINLSSSAGKVVLVDSTTGLACNGGSAPCTADQLARIVDLVGYGGANFFEGTPAPAPSTTTAALRAQDGCLDTDNNGTDFGVGTPTPRNSGSAPASCGIVPTVVPIYEIQGSGATSPLAGSSVTTSGVVTRVNNNGFFLQDPLGDGLAETSDGLFVFTGSAPAVAAGDLVQLTGTVAEFNTGASTNAETAAHPVTELTGISGLQVLATGQTIAPTAITLPEAVADELERVEGMLVTITTPLTVSQNFFLGRYGQLTLSSGGRLQTPTNVRRPGPGAQNLAARNRLRSILLDDGTTQQNPNPTPYIGEGDTVRAGDRIATLAGVVDYGLATSSSSGIADYKIHPTVAPVIQRLNERRASPPSVGGNLRVASFNTLNFFTTFTDGTTADGQTGQGCSLDGVVAASNCRGASNLAEFERQRTKIVEAIAGLKADVVGLMEIQNNGATAVQNLVGALNAKLGAGTYAVLPDPASGTGTDAIKVAMIYKPAKVTPQGASGSDTNPVHNRPPLAQTYVLRNGAPITVVVNHFKSKSCDGAAGADLDQGDLQGCYNARRVQQAQALRAFVATLEATSGTPDALLIGDFNAYAMEDPIFDLTSNGFVNQMKDKAYSYVFDGAAGRLDHLITSASLAAKVSKAAEWHINADEPSFLDYNLEFKQPACPACEPDLYSPTPYRSSDHDPALIGLDLPAPPAAARRAR